MIRSFFAIELPEEFRAEILRLESYLKKTGADVKWVRPESVHLTLKFIGNIAEADAGPLAGAVGEAVRDHGPLKLRFNALGCFPNLKRIRVVWLGLDGELEKLRNLQKAVENAAAGFGIEPEKRPYQPHLTLGRARSGHNQTELGQALDQIKPRDLDFTADRVIMFKSDLKPTGAVYTPLEVLPLAERNTEDKQ